MSDQTVLPGFEGYSRSGNRPSTEEFRASIAREIRYLLTVSADASKPSLLRPAGVAHSLGVCLIEDWNMARGKGKERDSGAGGNLPTFVDVKLDAEQRKSFVDWFKLGGDRTVELQQFADSGYRVGVAWSGEHQSYTVSVTCRDADSPNNGLCMTSFSKDLRQAVALAWYKHEVVCGFAWQSFVPGKLDSFG